MPPERKTLKELRAEKAELKAELSQIHADSGGDYDAEQTERVEEILSSVKDIESEEAERERAGNAAAAARAALESRSEPKPRRTEPSAVAHEFGGRAEAGEPRWKEDPMFGFRDHAEMLNQVIEATRHGREPSEQLQFLSAVGSDEQGTHSDAYGGFAVPEAMLPGLRTVPSQNDPIGPLVNSIPMTSPIVKFNAAVDKNHTSSVSGGLQVYRREETGALTSSRLEMEQIKLEANMLAGLAYATTEILQASPISFAQLIANAFDKEFPSKKTKERLNGTGVGQFLGVLNSGNGSLIEVTRAGSGNDIDGIDLVKMAARSWGFGNSVWMANPNALPDLIQAHIAGTNSDTAVWTSSLQQGVPNLILGRPVIFSEYMPSKADAGGVLLADWSQYVEGTYGGRQRASSIHVRFVNHEEAFRFSEMNAAAPWWRSALTPVKGADTLSPFVTLAAA